MFREAELKKGVILIIFESRRAQISRATDFVVREIGARPDMIMITLHIHVPEVLEIWANTVSPV